MDNDPESNKGLLYNDGTSAPHSVSFRVDHALGQVKVRNADKVFIVKVEWCKRCVPPFHEFLVFYVKGPLPKEPDGPERVSVLLAERYVDDEGYTLGPTAESTAQDEDGSGISASKGGNAGKWTRMLWLERISLQKHLHTLCLPRAGRYLIRRSLETSRKDAFDRFSFSHSGSNAFVTREQKEHDILTTLQVERGLFSVTQLAVLADNIHCNYKEYSPLQYSCYWFAATIYTVIKKITGGKENKGDVCAKRGKWKAVTIHRARKAFIANVMREFDKAWNEFAETLHKERIAEAERNEKMIRERAEEMVRAAEDRANIWKENSNAWRDLVNRWENIADIWQNGANEWKNNAYEGLEVTRTWVERAGKLEETLQKEREVHKKEMDELRRSVTCNVSVSA